MLEFALQKFPAQIELSGGRPCTIRLMGPGDEAAFRSFHLAIPDREQLFVMSEIRDGSLFDRWLSDPGFNRDLPLVAHVDGHLAAIAALSQRAGGWKRHIGRVSFLTHPDFRGLGLIDSLLKEVIELSRHCGLTKLESEINGERTAAIQSMQAAGFEELLRLPDYIRDMRAHHHDYVLMGRDLFVSFENLGTGD